MRKPTHQPCRVFVLGVIMFCTLGAFAATEQVLHEFSAQQRGAEPNGLVADSSGNLFGSTVEGGQSNLGTIFELSPKAGGGWTETVLHSFAGGSDSVGPYTPVLDAQGNVYGETGASGYDGCNCVYKLARNASGGWTKTVIYTFPSSAGTTNGLLVFDGEGNLYGALSSYNNGYFLSVFKLSPSSNTWNEQTLYTFSAGNASSYPNIAGLVIDGEGDVFGTLSITATATQGFAFELKPSSGGSWTEQTLYTFPGRAAGGVPTGPLFLNGGNLFGTTLDGGSTTCNGSLGCGVVYELVKGAGGQWSESALFAFTGDNVGEPSSPSLGGFDNSGNLYGSSLTGGAGGCSQCGSVFELSPAGNGTWTQTYLWKFAYNGPQSMYYPEGLVATSTGQVYGIIATPFGFYDEQGSIFELSPRPGPGAWNFNLLYIFPFTDGQWPSPGLLADKAGNLYGTTAYGGANNIGSIYEISPIGNGWKDSVLYSFGPASSVAGFSAGPFPLTFDANGNLYGTTQYGGAYSLGSVFELSPKAGGGWQEKDLYSFQSVGPVPTGGVIFDSAGHIYFPTNVGGSQGFGAVFQLTQNANGTWQGKSIYSFKGYPSDGANPYARLTLDSAGNIYGTTERGGDGNCYEGRNQVGCGTAFELAYSSTTGWTETILHKFEGSVDDDGSSPIGTLIWDAAGNLYGTASTGGTDNKRCPTYGYGPGCGAVFELSPSSTGWKEAILYEFVGGTTDGENPGGGLVWDQAGNLYGTLNSGAASEFGGLYELSPTVGGWTETLLYSFGSGSDGRYPYGSLILGPSGSFYGVTAAGGVAGGPDNSGQGTVFEFTP